MPRPKPDRPEPRPDGGRQPVQAAIGLVSSPSLASRPVGLVTAKVCQRALWRVCAISERLNLQLAPPPREVVGCHGIVAATGMTGPVLQMLEPNHNWTSSLRMEG